MIRICGKKVEDAVGAEKTLRLIRAARDGDRVQVEDLLAEGADPNGRDEILGLTAGAWAALDGHAGVLETLAKAGWRMDEWCRDGDTAVLAAVRRGQAESLSELLRLGASPRGTEEGSPSGSAGHAAAMFGRAECLDMLIKAGLDLGIRDENGDTAGHVAAREDRVEMLRELLDAGLDESARNMAGESVEDVARREGASGCERELARRRVAREEEAALRGETPEAKGAARRTGI